METEIYTDERWPHGCFCSGECHCPFVNGDVMYHIPLFVRDRDIQVSSPFCDDCVKIVNIHEYAMGG